MLAHNGSLPTRSKKFRSHVRMISGSATINCSMETRARPLCPATAATLRPPARSMISVLIEPTTPVSKPSGPRAQIDTWALFGGGRLQHLVDAGERGFNIRGQALAARLHAENASQQPQRCGRRLEAAIDQDVGELDLLLHIVGERHVGLAHGAEVEDQVGLRFEYNLEVGRAASSCSRRPSAGRSRYGAAMNGRSSAVGGLGQPVIFSGANM